MENRFALAQSLTNIELMIQQGKLGADNLLTAEFIAFEASMTATELLGTNPRLDYNYGEAEKRAEDIIARSCRLTLTK